MTTTIDFNDLSRGTIVDTEYKADGVTVSSWTAQGDDNRAMIFDTANPTGEDHDLATHNLGNVLILSEDGDSHDPDDNLHGGLIRFDFDQEASVKSLTFLDIEHGADVNFYDAHGNLLATHWVSTGDNGMPSVATTSSAPALVMIWFLLVAATIRSSAVKVMTSSTAKLAMTKLKPHGA